MQTEKLPEHPYIKAPGKRNVSKPENRTRGKMRETQRPQAHGSPPLSRNHPYQQIERWSQFIYITNNLSSHSIVSYGICHGNLISKCSQCFDPPSFSAETLWLASCLFNISCQVTYMVTEKKNKFVVNLKLICCPYC